jgi:hypothetical protein
MLSLGFMVLQRLRLDAFDRRALRVPFGAATGTRQARDIYRVWRFPPRMGSRVTEFYRAVPWRKWLASIAAEDRKLEPCGIEFADGCIGVSNGEGFPWPDCDFFYEESAAKPVKGRGALQTCRPPIGHIYMCPQVIRIGAQFVTS